MVRIREEGTEFRAVAFSLPSQIASQVLKYFSCIQNSVRESPLRFPRLGGHGRQRIIWDICDTPPRRISPRAGEVEHRPSRSDSDRNWGFPARR